MKHERPLMDPMAEKVRQRILDDANQAHWARFAEWQKAEDERFAREFPDLVLTPEELRERRMYHGKELAEQEPLAGRAVQMAKTVSSATEKYR